MSVIGQINITLYNVILVEELIALIGTKSIGIFSWIKTYNYVS